MLTTPSNKTLTTPVLEHLISSELEAAACETEPPGLVRLSRTTPGQLLDAQVRTADWMEEHGLTTREVEPAACAATAREAFQAVATADPKTHEQLLSLTVPEEVRHLVGMLTAYDWEFVQEARKLRGFVVAKLLEEATAAGKAGDRIKALGMLGKVTEVGLFTEKVEVKATPQSDAELDDRIKARLDKLRGVMDALPRPATTLAQDIPHADEPDA